MNKFQNMSDAELLAFANQRMPFYRRSFARVRSFLVGLLGRSQRKVATAGDYVVDVSGTDGVKGGGRIKLASFKAPNFTKLRQHVSALQESDAMDELSDLIDALKKSENKVVKAQAAKMLPMLNTMLETFNDALEALENIADKHLPSEVAVVFAAADKAATDIMRAYTGDESLELDAGVLIGAEEDHLDFVQYYDVSSHIESRLYIYITCSLNSAGGEYVMSRHVTVLDRFQAPMNYDIGEETNDLAKSIKQQLAIHGVVAATSTVELKVDATRLRTSLKKLPFVSKVEVTPKSIDVYVKGHKRTFEEEKELFALLSTDTDIRRMMGRSRRLISNFTDDNYWQFTVGSRS